MRRVVIVGAVGSGKTTLGRRTAAALGLPYTDIDALDLLPGWRHRPRAEFQRLLAARAAEDAWVMGGDFANSAGPVAWPRADTIVWLDLPRALTLWRTLRRAAREVRRHEQPYPGSAQTWRSVLRTGLIGMALRHPGKKRRTHPALLREHAAPGAAVWRLTSRRSVERWVRAVEHDARAPRASRA